MSPPVSTLEFLEPPQQSDELGRLGPYRIIDTLGKGGMGDVLLAEDTRLKRSVALKLMNRQISLAPNSRVRFLDEARAMAAVHHDNVVTIFEVGEQNGTPFMAMEVLQGETLEAVNISKRRLTESQIIDVALQIAAGLHAAHSRGIIHRDIKPANIWIQPASGRVKILDFGLAVCGDGVDRLSGRNSVIGSPGYLSPEQARNDPVDDRTDLYSVGVVLYQLCCGKLPLASRSISGQLINILTHQPQPLRERNPDISKSFAAVIDRLLSKEPVDRPRSAQEIRSTDS